MPTIAGITCDLIHGVLPPAMSEQSERWAVSGIDGEGIVLTGKRGTPFTLVAVKYGTNAEINTWATSLAEKEGIKDQVFDGFNDSQVVFLASMKFSKQAAVVPGGTKRVRGECRIECLLVDLPVEEE